MRRRLQDRIAHIIAPRAFRELATDRRREAALRLVAEARGKARAIVREIERRP